MFHKKVKIGKSRLHGIGLFASENISKDTWVYTPNLKLDVVLSNSEYKELAKEHQNYIAHYGYFDKKLKKWHLAHDDIRFCNHSKNPNLTLRPDGKIYAKVNIKKNQELLQDYSEFEELRKVLK